MLYTFSVNWDSALSYGQWINSVCFTCNQLPFPHVGQCKGFELVCSCTYRSTYPPTHLLKRYNVTSYKYNMSYTSLLGMKSHFLTILFTIRMTCFSLTNLSSILTF
jgi:hypothetical protein